MPVAPGTVDCTAVRHPSALGRLPTYVATPGSEQFAQCRAPNTRFWAGMSCHGANSSGATGVNTGGDVGGPSGRVNSGCIVHESSIQLADAEK